MRVQRELCERIKTLLEGSAALVRATVSIEDDVDPQSSVDKALARDGVLILVATSGHRRKPGTGSSTAGDASIEITVFENPHLNRIGDPDALTVTSAAEAVVAALHWQTVEFADGSTSRIVYGDMGRTDADDGDFRMTVGFTAFKSLSASDAVRWGAGTSCFLGEVVDKTATRGGTPVFEPGRNGDLRFAGCRDRHWRISLTCAVVATLAEGDLPEIGAPFTYGGRTYLTESSELHSSGEDTSTVTLTGRTIS